MSAKGKRWISSKILIIFLLIISIIAAAYILLTSNPGKTENILTVKEVLDRSEELIRTQEEITVEGYYNYYDVDIAEVTDTITLPGGVPPEDKLLVDRSDINVTLDEGNLYHFTGKLTYDEINPALPILVANKIEPK